MSRRDDQSGAGRRTLAWAVVAFAATVASITAVGTVGGIVWGGAAEGAIAGAIWGFVLALIWVLPVAFLGRSRRAEKKWHGDSPRENMRDPGRFGGPEGGGFF